MATTLMELAQERAIALTAEIALLSAVKAETDPAQPVGSVAEAEEAVAVARASRDAVMGRYGAASADISRIRKDLAKPLMPSELEALAKDLRAAIIEQRGANGDLLHAEEAQHAARVELDLRVTALGRAKEDLAAEEKEAAAAAKREARLAGWLAAMTASTARASAGVALGEDPYAAAKTRVEGDIPEELRDLARQRGEFHAGRVAGAAETRDHALDLLEARTVSAADQSNAELTAAEADFESLFRLTERLDFAVARLAAIAAAKPLTGAEHDRIHTGGIPSQGVPASALEAAIYDARTAREAASGSLDRLELDIAAGGGSPTPAQATERTTLEADLATAQADLAAAIAAFTTTEKNRLERWEAAVPEHVWKLLIEFDRAQADLIAVRDAPTAAAAMAAVEAAEADLVAEIDAEEEEFAIRELLDDAHSRLTGKHALLEGIGSRRHLSAVRGDN